MKKNLLGLLSLFFIVLLISCASEQAVVNEIRFKKLFPAQQAEEADNAEKGTLSVLNETSTPKIFVIEGIGKGAENFKMQFTLKGNKDYFLKPGQYQIIYYAVLSLEQVSKTFQISAGQKLTLKFYDTDEFKSDFMILYSN